MALIRSAQSNSATCATPEDVIAGSYLVGFLVADDSFAPVGGPEGWTTLHANTAGDDFRYACYYTEITGDPEPSYTAAPPSAGFRIVAVIPEEGETLTGIISAMQDNNAGGTQTAPNLTNTEDAIRVFINAFATDTDYTILTPPAGFTAAGTLSGSGESTSQAVYYRVNPTGSTILGGTIVWNGADSSVNFSVLVTGGATPVPPPTEPTDVVAVAITPERIDVEWTNGTGHTGLYVHRVASGASAPDSSATRISDDLGASATSFSDTSVSPGGSYDYYIEAVNNGGSTFSVDFGSATTPYQVARPAADEDRGEWTTNTGGTSNLYQAIDEVTPNDADFVQSKLLAAGEDDTYLVRLEPLEDPMPGDNIIRFRYCKSAADGVQVDLRVALVDDDGITELGDPVEYTDIGTDMQWGTLTYTGDLGAGPYYVKFTASSPES